MTKTILIALIFYSCVNSTQNHKVVKIVKDGIIESQNIINEKGELEKQIFFDTNGRQIDSLLLYYTAHKLDSVSLSNSVIEYDKEGYEKYFHDLEIKLEILEKRNVIIPYSFLNGSEVSDVSNMLNSVDSIKKIKNGKYSTIILNDIDQNIRFYPSTIEQFIPQNTIIHKYQLELKNDTILNEQYEFVDGKFKRNYIYEDGDLIKILSIASYINDEKEYKSVKEFK